MVDFKALAAPFPKTAVHWRAQTVIKKGAGFSALALAYIDSRDVQERLDQVVGPENWQSEPYDCGVGRLGCKLWIRLDSGEWIFKADGAGATDVEADKGAFSDALKRSAVLYGIGRYLYGLGNTWVPCDAVEATGGRSKYRFKKFRDDPWNHVKGPAAEAVVGPLGKSALQDELRACNAAISAETVVTSGDLEAVKETYLQVIQQAERDLPDWAAKTDSNFKQRLMTLPVGPRSVDPDNRETYAD